MANPLHENCQAFKTDASGKVTGVLLGITKVEGALYEVYSVRLRDEYEANDQTVAVCSVVDKNGIATGIQARLAWPGKGPMFENSGLPGNPNNVHVIINPYNPPNQGPLALHIGAFNASISDIVYGLGLPFNRHVGYEVTFREKGTVIDPPTDPDEDERIVRLETWARAMSAKYPQGPQYA